jgi:uroporphyrinogen decarboxylase
MQRLTPRERSLRCIRFEPADRLCLEGIFRPEVWKTLEQHFGTGDRAEINRRLGIGFLAGVGRNPDPAWLERSVDTPHGRAVVHADGSLESEWGVRKIWDATGTYERYAHHPMADPAGMRSCEFPPLDHPAVWDGCRDRVAALKKTELVAAPIPTFYRWGWELRGMENFMCDIAAESEELVYVLDRLEEYHVELARRYGCLGVEVLKIWGDLAMQTTTLMAPAAWRKHFKPRMANVIETGRKNGIQYVYLHSDGNNMPIVDDLVEVGVDILDPVQPECMDPAELRQRHPGLVLHGTISSQRTLPFGSLADVRNEVLDRIERCGRRNGLALAPNNVVQFDVPLEHLLCVYDTVREIGPGFYRG